MMDRMKKHLLLLALSAGTAFSIKGQDFHLTQYDAAKIYLNPALTGGFNGYYRIHANYRNQWKTISTKPFTTGALAFDMPVRKMGIGVQVMNYRAGAGLYNAFTALVS